MGLVVELYGEFVARPSRVNQWCGLVVELYGEFVARPSRVTCVGLVVELYGEFVARPSRVTQWCGSGGRVVWGVCSQTQQGYPMVWVWW